MAHLVSKILIFLLVFQPYVWAATHYIGSDAVATYGSTYGHPDIDDWNGTSMGTGDDLKLQRGDTFTLDGGTDNILVNWNGTSGDWIEIEAWAVSGEESFPNPIIDGEKKWPGETGGIGIDDCKLDGKYDGRVCTKNVIRVTDKDYVRIKDIDFVNILGGGPSFNDGCTNVDIDNIKVVWTWVMAFRFSKSNDVLVENSEFGESAINMDYTPKKPKKSFKGGGVVFSANSYNIEVRKNYFHDARGEGLDLVKGTKDFQVYQNEFYHTRHAAITVDQAGEGSTNSYINWNLIVCKATDGIGRGIKYNGITVNAEENPRDYNVGDTLVFGNWIVGGGNVGITLGSNNPLSKNFKNVRIINNSIIGTDHCFRVSNSYAGSDWTTSYVENNLCVFNEAFTTSVKALNAGYDLGLRFRGNYYGRTGGIDPANPSVYIPLKAQHAKDKYGTNPTELSISASRNYVKLGAEITDARLMSAQASGVDSSGESSKLFHRDDTDVKTASFVTLASEADRDFGAVDFGGSIGTEAICDDDIDNDSDGATDCDDIDCKDDSACTQTEVNCLDQIDNDDDGDIDCADTDCQTAEDYCTTTETICDDTIDNDGDGKIDCFSGLEDEDCTCEDPTYLNKFKMEGGHFN